MAVERSIGICRRIGWADTARGVAIFLVVLGHTCPPPYTTAFIYAFHMPLFFVLSGLFLKVDEPLVPFLKKKARTLLVPFVIYNLVLLVSDWFIVAFSPNHHEAVDIPGRLLGTLTGWHGGSWNSSLWFLPCLFVAQLMVVGCYHLVQNLHPQTTSPEGNELNASASQRFKSSIFLWLLLSLAGVAYCHWVAQPLPMSLDSALVATGFLLMGRQIMKLNLRREAWWYWAITVLIFVSTTLDNYAYLGGGDNHIDLSTDILGQPLSFYLAASAGSLLLIRACQWCEESTLGSMIPAFSWLGRNSLIIYCLHRIPMNLGIGIWNAVVGIPTCPSTFYTLIRSIALLVFTLLLLIPAIYIVNRWLPWTLGKPFKREVSQGAEWKIENP